MNSLKHGHVIYRWKANFMLNFGPFLPKNGPRATKITQNLERNDQIQIILLYWAPQGSAIANIR